MRHIVTAREFVDRLAVGERFSGPDLTVAMALADAVDTLKADPRAVEQTTLGTLTADQKAAALAFVVALLVAHEIDQDLREGVCP